MLKRDQDTILHLCAQAWDEKIDSARKKRIEDRRESIKQKWEELGKSPDFLQLVTSVISITGDRPLGVPLSTGETLTGSATENLVGNLFRHWLWKTSPGGRRSPTPLDFTDAPLLVRMAADAGCLADEAEPTTRMYDMTGWQALQMALGHTKTNPRDLVVAFIELKEGLEEIETEEDWSNVLTKFATSIKR